jgi:hypothetical protein
MQHNKVTKNNPDNTILINVAIVNFPHLDITIQTAPS